MKGEAWGSEREREAETQRCEGIKGNEEEKEMVGRTEV